MTKPEPVWTEVWHKICREVRHEAWDKLVTSTWDGSLARNEVWDTVQREACSGVMVRDEEFCKVNDALKEALDEEA
jgi:hypothetical protein